MNNDDEFYIGWQAQAPPAIGRRMRGATLLLITFAVGFGALLALAQGTLGVSVFEWGRVKSFSGILIGQPYPHLLVPRPGVNGTVVYTCPFPTGEIYLGYVRNLNVLSSFIFFVESIKLGFLNVNVLFNLGILAVLTVGYRIVSLFLFLLLANKRR